MTSLGRLGRLGRLGPVQASLEITLDHWMIFFEVELKDTAGMLGTSHEAQAECRGDTSSLSVVGRLRKMGHWLVTFDNT